MSRCRTGKVWLAVTASLLGGMALSAVQADEVPLAFAKASDVAKGVHGFPRLAAGDAMSRKINAALAKGDARAKAGARSCLAEAGKRGDWSRSVEITMKGPRLVSYVATDDYFCGGAYPDTSTQALVYDLTTGIPVDWARFLPPALLGEKGTTKAADGTVLGTLSSPALTALYVKAVKPADIDPSCQDALDSQPLHFLAWPDAKADGLALLQTDLPHVTAACGPAATVPMAELRSAGVDPALLDAIEAAHKALR
ncbi:hypothetical protein ACMDCR_22365 [Labrys okinawensis]|uniref:hypothetical protein n=1 Tax=Labrys okinawensis TaxID=346911 RepID=UPI0039BD32E4